MKFAKYLASFAIVALTLSLSAFARDMNSGKFTLTDTTQVGSKKLAPGDYKAEWSGPANDLKVNITKGGKVVATTEGQIKELPKPAPYDAVTVRTLSNKTISLQEVDFNNRKEVLVLKGA
jgi:hypothetical protein